MNTQNLKSELVTLVLEDSNVNSRLEHQKQDLIKKGYSSDEIHISYEYATSETYPNAFRVRGILKYPHGEIIDDSTLITIEPCRHNTKRVNEIYTQLLKEVEQKYDAEFSKFVAKFNNNPEIILGFNKINVFNKQYSLTKEMEAYKDRVKADQEAEKILKEMQREAEKEKREKDFNTLLEWAKKHGSEKLKLMIKHNQYYIPCLYAEKNKTILPDFFTADDVDRFRDTTSDNEEYLKQLDMYATKYPAIEFHFVEYRSDIFIEAIFNVNDEKYYMYKSL